VTICLLTQFVFLANVYCVFPQVIEILGQHFSMALMCDVLSKMCRTEMLKFGHGHLSFTLLYHISFDTT
jgi:hypothetical protein